MSNGDMFFRHKRKENYMCLKNKAPSFIKKEEPKMFKRLKDTVAKFKIEQNIKECLHKYDT